jgi:hypothetical protein
MVSSIKLIIYILVIISTFLILRTSLTPTPATPAYLANNVATFLAFIYAYYKTKDKFWLIMSASVPPMFISDLYFLPSFGGLFWSRPEGMNTWAGIHQIIISLGCFFYFKKSSLRYAIPIALFAVILTNTSFSTFSLSRSAAGYITGLAWQTITIYYLVYYGMNKKKFVFSTGAVIQLIGLIIVVLYYFYVSHDIQPITLSLTDKIIAFSRGPLAIGAI